MMGWKISTDAIGWHFGGYTGERRMRPSGCVIMHALAWAQMRDIGLAQPFLRVVVGPYRDL